GCTTKHTPANGNGAAADKVRASISGPASGAKAVSTAAEITFTTKKATGTTVALTDAAGGAVQGALRADGSSWVPATQLKYATTYTAKVTATGPGGQSATATSTFTTTDKPAATVAMHSYIGDNLVVGVGAPLV